jgi:hypothetical protein
MKKQSLILFAAGFIAFGTLLANDSFASNVVSFGSYHHTYFVSESNGGSGQTVNANRSAIGPWEKFSMANFWGGCTLNGSQVTIRTSTGYYWSAQPNGDLDVDRTAIGPWEIFTVVNHTNTGGCLVPGDVISLLSYHGKYVVAENSGAANANRTAIGPWEKFTVIIHLSF